MPKQRLTDDQLQDAVNRGGTRESMIAQELMEARKRGTMPTVDSFAANRIPTNMKDGMYVPSDGGGVIVAAWTPEADGKGRPTQVHLTQDLSGIVPGLRAVVRLKSGRGVDNLINLLHQYRCEVWPHYKGLKLKGKR